MAQQERPYLAHFRYITDMLNEIDKHPLLAEKLTNEFAFKDFLCTVALYEEDIKNSPSQ